MWSSVDFAKWFSKVLVTIYDPSSNLGESTSSISLPTLDIVNIYIIFTILVVSSPDFKVQCAGQTERQLV